MSAVLDHLVLAVADLDVAVADFERRTGVRPVDGGAHPGRGTRNALVGLTWEGGSRHYLELLGPDPDQPDVPVEAMMLGVGSVLAELAELGERAEPAAPGELAELSHEESGPSASRLYTWAVRPANAEDLDAMAKAAHLLGVDAGRPVDASRKTPSGAVLSWRLAVPEPLGLGGVQPFLIEWGETHPTDADLPTVELASLTLQHPKADSAAKILTALGVSLPVSPGPEPRLRATVVTPQGEVVLD